MRRRRGSWRTELCLPDSGAGAALGLRGFPGAFRRCLGGTEQRAEYPAAPPPAWRASKPEAMPRRLRASGSGASSTRQAVAARSCAKTGMADAYRGLAVGTFGFHVTIAPPPTNGTPLTWRTGTAVRRTPVTGQPSGAVALAARPTSHRPHSSTQVRHLVYKLTAWCTS